MPISFPTGYFNDPTVNPNPALGQKGLNQYNSALDPTPLNDNTQGFVSGSQWFNTTNNRLWECISGATGAAVWVQANQNLANFRNLLDGGDFSVNPFQRDIAGIATSHAITGITSTATHLADRWAAKGGGSSSITYTKISDALLAGSSTHVQIQRANANADTAVIHFSHVMETADSTKAQGQQVTLSFYAKAGANFSSAAGALSATVYSGTGANDTLANMVAGLWAGSATPVTGTATLTTAWQRFQFTGTVAAAATQLGVDLSFTPVGTAGANDWFQVDMIQLEIGATASAPERRDVQVELEICQRYAFVIAEPASGVLVGMGACPTTTTATIYIAAPVQMRAAPTVTINAAGGFGVRPANATLSGTIAAGSTHTPNAITVNFTAVTITTAGFATPMLGGTGGGAITASADF